MKTSAIAMAAVLLASTASAANAATFLFSYEGSTGLLAGTIDGTLQADNNTIIINSVSNLTFDGSSVPDTPFTYLFSERALPMPGAGRTSIDGSFQDFESCQAPGGCVFGFGFVTDPSFFGVPLATASVVYGNIAEAYVVANWTLSGTGGAIPEPASWAMLIAGFGLIGATMRRRRTALAA